MQGYSHLLQILLLLYCLSSFAVFRSPLLALAYFLFFRSSAAIAAFLQVPSIGSMQFFLPALVILMVPTAAALAAKDSHFRMNRVTVTFAFFIVMIVFMSALAFLNGEDITEGTQEIEKYLFPATAYVLVYAGVRHAEDLDRFTIYISFSSLIPILTGIIEDMLGVGYDYDTDTFVYGSAPAGTIIDRNLYGIDLALWLFLALPRILAKNNAWNMAYLVILLFTIVISRNRGTWISLATAFMIAVPLFRRHLQVRNWLIGGIVIVLLSLPVMIARFGELKKDDEYGQKQDTAAGRLHHSAALLDKALNSPLIGNGPGSFSAGVDVDLLPHDDYLRVACEFGFLTLLVYLAFLLFQLSWTIRHRRDTLWQYQFSACAGQIYVIMISVAQNLLTDTVTYMLLFSLLALSHRASAVKNLASAPPQHRRPSQAHWRSFGRGLHDKAPRQYANRLP